MLRKYRANLKIFSLDNYDDLICKLTNNKNIGSLQSQLDSYEKLMDDLYKQDEIEYIKLTNLIVSLGGLISVEKINSKNLHSTAGLFWSEIVFKISEDKISQIKDYPLVGNIEEL
jgi:hypothetical protein